MGGKGSGSSFSANRQALERIRLRMRVLHDVREPDIRYDLWGRRYDLPLFAAPVGGVEYNMTKAVTEEAYTEAVVRGALQAGTLGGIGDGEVEEIFDAAVSLVAQSGGRCLPFIKPWEAERALDKIRRVREAGAFAVGMDVDAAGLVTLKEFGCPVYPKPAEELRRLTGRAGVKFIVKGIMEPDEARRALEAGADALVVSNHGGRVLDGTPGTAEILPAVAAEVNGAVPLFVDGGIRSGSDIFKMLALGADAVLVGRPLAIAAIGGGSEGVADEIRRMGQELYETMLMTGCRDLASITEAAIYPPFSLA